MIDPRLKTPPFESCGGGLGDSWRTASGWRCRYAACDPVRARDSSPCNQASSGSERGYFASESEDGRGAGYSCAWISPSSSHGCAAHPTISSTPEPVCTRETRSNAPSSPGRYGALQVECHQRVELWSMEALCRGAPLRCSATNVASRLRATPPAPVEDLALPSGFICSNFAERSANPPPAPVTTAFTAAPPVAGSWTIETVKPIFGCGTSSKPEPARSTLARESSTRERPSFASEGVGIGANIESMLGAGSGERIKSACVFGAQSSSLGL
mmetsp:Transcript_17073/g.36038  ORF Transcript_17073/g.36038 Transcript_17073/m.36038 type:complete len:271 (+) Transcript_17073:1376-2188(+)